MSSLFFNKRFVMFLLGLLACLLLLPACSDDGSSADGDLPPADQDTELVDRENPSDGDLEADLPDSDPPPADMDETPVDGDRDTDLDSDGDTDANGDSDADGDRDLDNETPETDGDILEFDADPDGVDNIEIEPDVETESDSASEMEQEPDIETLNLSMDTFPFEDTTIVRCEDGRGFRVADVWSNDAGKAWFAGNHFWEYDEAGNELRCDERVNEYVFTLDGRLLEDQVEIWIATATRLGRLYQGEWSFFDLPAELVPNETTVDSENAEEVKHPYSLKVQDAVVTLNVALQDHRKYDSTYFYFTDTQAWNRVPACEGMRAQLNEVGYWFGETYYLMGGNRLYALTPNSTDCSSAHDFSVDFGDDVSRLVGVDENGLWIARHSSIVTESADYRIQNDLLRFNPLNDESVSFYDELPLPDSYWGDRVMASTGMGGWPLMVATYNPYYVGMIATNHAFIVAINLIEPSRNYMEKTSSIIIDQWDPFSMFDFQNYANSYDAFLLSKVWRGERQAWLITKPINSMISHVTW